MKTSAAEGGGAVNYKHRMTMCDLCETYSVSHEAVLKHIRRKDDPLPAMRFGRRWIFDIARVEAWMTRQAKRIVVSVAR